MTAFILGFIAGAVAMAAVALFFFVKIADCVPRFK